MITLKKHTCRECETVYDSFEDDDYIHFCSQRCAMAKYGYEPEDFYPTTYQDREVE